MEAGSVGPVTGEALRLARIVWDYHQLKQEPAPADVIVALGTHDLRVAEFAAQLYLARYGPTLVCTGGVAHEGDLLATPWEKTEAEMYAEVAVRLGVPRERILLETRASNTAENLRFTRALLAGRGIRPRNILIAVKPFMQRRVWATLAVEWPGMPATLASPRLTLEEYFTPELPPEKIVNILLGDLQRLWVYARKGWSAPQQFPAEVLDAYQRLVELGFTKHLISA
ncbi:MAG: YdcF family protein [Acidobacteria bacterium]|nr:YdcF family protein [Acidobacteriota bacterium]